MNNINKGYPLNDGIYLLLVEIKEYLESDDGIENSWLNRIDDILTHDRNTKKGDRAIALVREVIYNFPQHGTDETVNGIVAVDWIMEFITRAKKELV